MRRMIVAGFGGPEVVELRHRPRTARRPAAGCACASRTPPLGSTDALARRGGYLLQPRPGFTPGYDLVGVLETVDPRVRGTRPRHQHQGGGVPAADGRAWATSIDLPPQSGWCPCPRRSPPRSRRRCRSTSSRPASPPRSPPFHPRARCSSKGPQGRFGALLVQHARAAGAPGDRHLVAAEPRGGRVPLARGGSTTAIWKRRPASSRRRRAGVAAAVDHTGSRDVRGVVASGGTVVRLSFVGRPGRERRDTASGSMGGNARAHRRTTARTPRLGAALRGDAAPACPCDARRRARSGRPRRAPAARGRGAPVHGSRRRTCAPRPRRREHEARPRDVMRRTDAPLRRPASRLRCRPEAPRGAPWHPNALVVGAAGTCVHRSRDPAHPRP